MTVTIRKVWWMIARTTAMSRDPVKQAVDNRQQVVAYLDTVRQLVAVLRGLAVARCDQPGGASRCHGSLQIPERIAYRRDAGKIRVVAQGDVGEQSRKRLAARATIVRAVWAHENRVNAPTGFGHDRTHLSVNAVQGIGAEQPACDARLVAGHNDPPVVLGQQGDGLEAARNRRPLVGGLDEGVTVVVDDAVPVKDDQLHDSSREISAT